MIDKSVNDKNPRPKYLWRYVSLDKLIDLLRTEELFFTPLSAYEKSDPFEGYQPRVVIESYLRVWQQHKETMKMVPHYDEEMRAKIEEYPQMMLERYKRIIKASMVVNCWHSNDYESEAMWRLYSESGKGIVIKTDIESLKAALEDDQCNKVTINMGIVKYVNFLDKTLDFGDCVVGDFNPNKTHPLLKRLSYKHEEELRLFITREVIDERQSEWYYERVKINPKRLVMKIITSPFAPELFFDSVRAVCLNYGIEDSKIRKSVLLNPDLLFQ